MATVVVEGLVEETTLMADFVVFGEPTSKARARLVRRGDRVGSYTPKATANAEEMVRDAFWTAVPASFTREESCALGIEVAFFCATRQRRDVDNMLKLILDALNHVAFADDSQIVELIGRKHFVEEAEDARSEVTLYRLPDAVVGLRTTPCLQCGTPVIFYRSAPKKFCSRDCRASHRRAATELLCEYCGALFATNQPPSKHPRFCGAACRLAAGSTERVCVVCGENFLMAGSVAGQGRAMVCGPECRQGYWREHREIVGRGRCADCGGPTSKKSYQRCQACAYLAGSHLSIPIWKSLEIRRLLATGAKQKEVAGALGVSQSSVSRISRGQRT